MRSRNFMLVLSLLLAATGTNAQAVTSLSSQTGLRLIVVREDYPLLKILLPGQPASDRGIEIEFPEHVTGLNEQTKNVEHLYLVSNGSNNKRTAPAWRVANNKLIYETELEGRVSMTATAQLEPDGVRYTYKFTNHSSVPYSNFQAVTCVQLYSLFSDTLLQRTYVHQPGGFDLLASETPARLTMPLQEWLPCRYLVSYTWPVAPKRFDKNEDGITMYHRSRKTDKPFLATLSHDKTWVAATYTKETGNLWTNPERTCQHADPAVALGAGQTKSIWLKTFLLEGGLLQLLQVINKDR